MDVSIRMKTATNNEDDDVKSCISRDFTDAFNRFILKKRKRSVEHTQCYDAYVTLSTTVAEAREPNVSVDCRGDTEIGTGASPQRDGSVPSVLFNNVKDP
ncbi:Hypothetical protein SMAX5B_000597 [Scophthalmus maximus]|uniref:Uncharacterized protein n=1 Tax=Scophthalmus maximus TaxID=52904 RepID=A0A2U9B5N9_SCOMX|nr:Hypothetical protein SMAX5B_000597 [Scophthalmus maximus]